MINVAVIGFFVDSFKLKKIMLNDGTFIEIQKSAFA
jgi:hypothetical protein